MRILTILRGLLNLPRLDLSSDLTFEIVSKTVSPLILKSESGLERVCIIDNCDRSFLDWREVRMKEDSSSFRSPQVLPTKRAFLRLGFP